MLSSRFFFFADGVYAGDTMKADAKKFFFGPSRPDPGRNARDQGPKRCKTKHVANLDGTPSYPGWDLDGPRIGPRRGSGWHLQRQ